VVGQQRQRASIIFPAHMNTSSPPKIPDPEAARQFRLFGKLIRLLTNERLRILKAATKGTPNEKI
jgi:hypothetical protein